MKKENKRKTPFRERFAEAVDLPIDTFSNMPQLQICGNREVTVEGYKSVLEYDDNMLRIKAKQMEICFWGTKLLLKYLNRESIAVCGKLDRIEFTCSIQSKEASAVEKG